MTEMESLVLTEKDVKAIKIALSFALEFSPAPDDLHTHMEELLHRFNKVAPPPRRRTITNRTRH